MIDMLSSSRAAAVIAVAASLLIGAAPKTAPANKPLTKPIPAGTIVRHPVPGGWLLEVAGDPDHATVTVPAHSAASERSLMLIAVTSKDFKSLAASTAALLDGGGRTLRALPLQSFRPIGGGISRDGKLAVVTAQVFEGTEDVGAVLAFDDAGRRVWRKPMTLGQEVVVADSFVALWLPPYVSGIVDGDPNEMPPAKLPAPVVFLKRDGTPLKPKEPVLGAIARAGDGIAAVASGRLAIYKGSLLKSGSATLGFEDGVPYASDNGATIAVADFTEGEKADRALSLHDATGKKLGEVRIPAAYGIAAALPDDGSAVLLTPAVVSPGGPVSGGDLAAENLLVLTGRDGGVRWKYKTKKRTQTERFAHLSVARGGKRAAAGLRADDGEDPDKVLVFGADGTVIYEAEGSFEGLWLDPTGAWLYTVEEGGLSRLKVDDLISGKAFPEEEIGSVNPPDDDMRDLSDADEGADALMEAAAKEDADEHQHPSPSPSPTRPKK